MHPDDLFKTEAEFEFDATKPPHLNTHFENRLFDRDTLSIHHFKINFLFVRRSYITQDGAQRQAFKTTAIQKIREEVLKFYNEHYAFYALTFIDSHALKSFVRKHFKDLNGKIYQTSIDDKLLWLALSNDGKQAKENKKIKDLLNELETRDVLMNMVLQPLM